MPELYESLGFTNHPFSAFSAEEEFNYIDKIFKSPRYFNSLASDLQNGASRFIFGERGSGKTTLIYQLKEVLGTRNIFSIMFDSYDGIEQSENKTILLRKITTELITVFAISLLTERYRLKKLDKYDKQKLSAFIDIFFRTLSKSEYYAISNSITHFKRTNIIKALYNYLFTRSINVAVSGAMTIVSDLVKRMLALHSIDTNNFFRTYLPELHPTTPQYNTSSFDYVSLRGIFLETTKIVKKSGYSNTVIFLDKIDEFSEFNGNVHKIASFIVDLATDTKLLSDQNVGFVFSLWHRVKPKLNASGVRFDKFKPIDVSWTKDDLVSIIDLRLKYFSRGGVIRFANLVLDFQYRELIKSLANGSPRDFLRLLSYIFDEQSINNIGNIYFENTNSQNGVLKFIREYDYYSLYPRLDNQDVLRMIGVILACGLQEFSYEQFLNAFESNPRLLNAELQTLQSFGLIENVGVLTDSTRYKVTDPKLRYLISRSIKTL